MKKKLLFFLFTSFFFVANAQEYQIKEDINYYADSISNNNDYIKKKCNLDIYYPTGVKNFGTIIWFHSGGLTSGKKEIPEALKNHGYAVVGVNYRLSPKVNAPAYIEDAAAATSWVFNHIKELGGNPNSIFISGHSAGGYLTLMLALDKSYLEKYHIDANKIAGAIPMSGQAITHFTIRKENDIKATQPIIDHYAPLYFVRYDAPPMLLITGDREKEMYGRYEENAYLSCMMKLIGNKTTTLYELQGYDHGGMTFPAFPLLWKFVRDVHKQLNTNN